MQDDVSDKAVQSLGYHNPVVTPCVDDVWPPALSKQPPNHAAARHQLTVALSHASISGGCRWLLTGATRTRGIHPIVSKPSLKNWKSTLWYQNGVCEKPTRPQKHCMWLGKNRRNGILSDSKIQTRLDQGSRQPAKLSFPHYARDAFSLFSWFLIGD